MSKCPEVALRAQALKYPYRVIGRRCGDDQTCVSGTRHSPLKGGSTICIPWKSEAWGKGAMAYTPSPISLAQELDINILTVRWHWGLSWDGLSMNYALSQVALQELLFKRKQRASV